MNKRNAIRSFHQELVLNQWMMVSFKGGSLQALKIRFGRGFSTTNLRYFRTLYTAYADRFHEIRQIGSGVLTPIEEEFMKRTREAEG
jgi:hypothetical protein